MFGYLTAYKDKLSKEEQERYQAYYCGLCRELGRKFGRRSQLILAYDPVFLALLYADLYDAEETVGRFLCVLKGKKVLKASCETLSFAADINLLTAYHNFRDQVRDGEGKAAKAAVSALKKAYARTAERYPEKKAALEAYMEKLGAYEQAPDDNPDYAANLTGEMCSLVFSLREDEYSEYLKGMFFSLGKFVYLCDAYTDVEKDRKRGVYNPYAALYGQPDFEEKVRWHLENVMEDCTRYFEMLPLIENHEILSNLLYSGIWMRYAEAQKEREEKTQEN